MDPFIGFFIEVEDGRAIGVRIGRWMYSAVMPKPGEGKELEVLGRGRCAMCEVYYTLQSIRGRAVVQQKKHGYNVACTVEPIMTTWRMVYFSEGI